MGGTCATALALLHIVGLGGIRAAVLVSRSSKGACVAGWSCLVVAQLWSIQHVATKLMRDGFALRGGWGRTHFMYA